MNALSQLAKALFTFEQLCFGTLMIDAQMTEVLELSAQGARLVGGFSGLRLKMFALHWKHSDS